jgi:signal transduction histidine kinase/CheY-like chemotaxis protein
MQVNSFDSVVTPMPSAGTADPFSTPGASPQPDRLPPITELDALYAAAPAGLCQFDLGFRYVRVNAALAAMNGLSIDAHIGRTPYEIVPSIAAAAEAIFGQVVTSRQPAQVELSGTTVPAPTDVRIWDEQWYPIEVSGALVGVGVVVTDITRRKRAEEELARAERRFRVSQEASPIAFTLMRSVRNDAGEVVDFTWEYVNPAASVILRRPAASLLGRRLLQELPGNAGSRGLFATYRGVVETGVASDYELSYASDGIEGWFRNIAVKLDDGVAVSFTDITARRRAEDAARVRSEQLQTLVEHAPIGVFVVDAALRLAAINPLARPVFAGCEPPVEGRDFEAVMREGWERGFADDTVRLFRHTLATGKSYVESERIASPRSGGPATVYDWRITRFALQGGHFGVVCYLRNITEQVATREALAAAKQTAELANAAKDRFIATLSHELRTPLTPVVAALELMHQDERLPADCRRHVEMIQRNVGLEVKLIDDLLDLGRVASGKLQLDRGPLDINQAVRDACDTCAAPARAKGIRIRCELDPAGARISGDAVRIQQVLWNLLRNATKFTPPDGEVTVTTSVRGDRIAVELRDTGVGIPADLLPRIFDAFEQGGERITRQFGGLGLGLAISKSLVELHGGTIEAQSDGPGRGAVFTLTFPALPAESAAGAGPAARQPANSPARAGLHVLLVEDHADSAAALSSMLTRRGYRVQVAHCVAEALQRCTTGRFDVLVSDLGLPDGKGYELMRRVAEQHHLPGIAMSGYGMEDDVRQSRAAGFSAHLVKPVHLDELVQALEQIAAARPAVPPAS